MSSSCEIFFKPRITKMTFKLQTDNISNISIDTTEDAQVQLVNIFNTNKTPLAKSTNHLGTKYLDGDIGLKCLRAYNSTELDIDGESSVKNKGSSNLPFSQTMKNYIRESIVLEASRFRLEQKSSIWDKYEVVKTLGKGAFGEVRMIKNKHTKARRALKTISKKNCETSKHYLEEIEILKHLVRTKVT